jgi:hypothetical protein
MVARLKTGVVLRQANADVERMLPMMARKFPPPGFSPKMFDGARLGPDVPIQTGIGGRHRQVCFGF